MYASLSADQQQVFQREVAQRYERFEMFDVAHKDIDQTIKDLRYSLDRYKNIKKEKEACEQKLQEFLVEFGDSDIRTQTLQSLVSTQGSLDGFAASATLAQRKMEENNALLERLKIKEFKTTLKSRYSRNVFAPTGSGDLIQENVVYSAEEVLRSIVDPSFTVDIRVEGTTGDLEQVCKRTDVFSVPLPGLDEKYSMGVLDYPYGVSMPVSVLEIRAYPRILGTFMLENMLPFLEAEISYCLEMQYGNLEADKRNLENLSLLSTSIKVFIDKFRQRVQEVEKVLRMGVGQ